MPSKEDLSLLHTSEQDELDTLHLVYDRLADERARGSAHARRPGQDAPTRDARVPVPVDQPGREPAPLLTWRSLGAFWVVLLMAAGSCVIALSIAGPPLPPAVRGPAQAGRAAIEAPTTPAPPPAPVPALALTTHLPEALPPRPEPSAAVPVRPSPPASQDAVQEALPRPLTAPAAPAPARRAAGAAGAGAAQPALVIHYPEGSLEGATDAQRLAAQAGAASGGGAVRTEAEGNAPAVATINYYDERDHSTARALGKAVQALGYRWRIERGSGSVGDAPAAVVVWLPAK